MLEQITEDRTDRSRLRQSFWIGLPVAFLPWLHTRLALPALLLGLVLLLRLGAAVHRRAATWRDVAAFITPIVLGLGGWFIFFRILYGTFNPSAPHWDHVPLGFRHIPTGLLGLLADQEFGLLANAPVHILWAGGVWALFKRDHRLAAELLLIVVPYVIAVSGFAVWFGGGSPPARYLVPIVFPLGFALAPLWARQDVAGRSLSIGSSRVQCAHRSSSGLRRRRRACVQPRRRPCPLVGLECAARRPSARTAKFLSSGRRTCSPRTRDDCASRDTSDRLERVDVDWLDPLSSSSSEGFRRRRQSEQWPRRSAC